MTRKLPHARTLYALALAALCLNSAAPVGAQQLASNSTPERRVASSASSPARLLKRLALGVTETAEGSRVRLTSDASVEGFRAYTEGGRLFVLVPVADAATLAGRAPKGEGFVGFNVEQSGDDALISFTPRAGYAPHVRAAFNRLEILFAAQKSSGGADVAASSPTPTPTPASTPADSKASDSTSAPATSKGAAPAATSSGATSAPGTSAARLAALLTPEKVAPTRLVRFDKPPVIDGKMDEDVWKTAAVFKDFAQFRPVDLVPPSQPTEVRIGYDSKFLYVAFHAFDEAGKVRATIAKRDAVFEDDWVGIWLDTFNDGRRSYEFIFNPLGVQADAIFTEGVSE
ncbi:MAG: carbohydrate binding family 9 domain-containing protein, partial [Pyrinomonadaceae bacterium]